MLSLYSWIGIAGFFVMGFGRFSLISERYISGFLFCLLAAFMGLFISIKELSTPVQLLFSFWIAAYAIGLAIASFERYSLPALLRSGPYRSLTLTLSLVIPILGCSVVLSFWGNVYGQNIGALLGLSAIIVTVVSLRLKTLNPRHAGIFISIALVAIVSNLSMDSAVAVVLLHLPWLMPIIRRPHLLDRPETKAKNSATEKLKSIVSRPPSQIEDDEEIPTLTDRVEPSIADLPMEDVEDSDEPVIESFSGISEDDRI